MKLKVDFSDLDFIRSTFMVRIFLILLFLNVVYKQDKGTNHALQINRIIGLIISHPLNYYW